MNMRDLLRIAFVGAVAYGFYKLGEKQGERKTIGASSNQKKKNFNDDIQDADVVEESNEEDYLKEIISEIARKPNKNRKDRDTLDLLQIKLQQLINKK